MVASCSGTGTRFRFRQRQKSRFSPFSALSLSLSLILFVLFLSFGALHAGTSNFLCHSLLHNLLVLRLSLAAAHSERDAHESCHHHSKVNPQHLVAASHHV